MAGWTASRAASATEEPAGPPLKVRTSATATTTASAPIADSRSARGRLAHHRERDAGRSCPPADAMVSSTVAASVAGTGSRSRDRVAATDRRWRSRSAINSGDAAMRASTSARRAAGRVPSASAQRSASSWSFGRDATSFTVSLIPPGRVADSRCASRWARFHLAALPSGSTMLAYIHNDAGGRRFLPAQGRLVPHPA